MTDYPSVPKSEPSLIEPNVNTPTLTREQCLAEAAEVLLQIAIRVAREDLARARAAHDRPALNSKGQEAE